jgi:hypothetical protein
MEIIIELILSLLQGLLEFIIKLILYLIFVEFLFPRLCYYTGLLLITGASLGQLKVEQWFLDQSKINKNSSSDILNSELRRKFDISKNSSITVGVIFWVIAPIVGLVMIGAK